MSRERVVRLEQLLAQKEIVVACGPGGVGKTTVAAALGVAAAQRMQASVLVVTIDPARRLADALGLTGIGNEARGVDLSSLGSARHRARGSLSVAMLDAAESWDALVRRYAEAARSAEEIIANPLYRNITTRFARSHEYVAMERLYELHASGTYDLLIIDTPPSQGALDFLDAPERMADFFSSRLLRWLISPMRSRFVNLASRPFSQLADRVLGTQLLEDLGRFFLLLQGMHDGFVERARSVQGLLRDPRTTFLLVATPEEVPLAEASRFIGALASRHLDLGLLVANKVLPESLGDEASARAADECVERADELGAELSAAGFGDAGELARVLGEIGQSFANFALLANRQAELLAELERLHRVGAKLPHLQRDVVDLATLATVGEGLFEAPLR